MLNPIDVFNSLDLSNSHIKRLRLALKEILEQYYTDYQEKQRIICDNCEQG